jgi:hypothetical protein
VWWFDAALNLGSKLTASGVQWLLIGRGNPQHLSILRKSLIVFFSKQPSHPSEKRFLANVTLDDLEK